MSDNSNDLFRPEASDSAASPDSLVQALVITSRLSWLALVAMTLLLGAVILGAYLVRVPLQVQGHGVLISAEGELLLSVSAQTGGRLKKLLVGRGESISAGQRIALVEQPELIDKVAELKRRHGGLVAKHKTILQLQKTTARDEASARARILTSIEEAIAHRKERLKWLRRREENEDALKKKGFITEQNYLKTKTEIATVQEALADKQGERKKLLAEAAEMAAAQNRERVDLDLQISQAFGDVTQAERELARSAVVVAAHDGVVSEIDVVAGDILSPDKPILRLLPPASDDRAGGRLKGVLYVPLAKGKQVKSGMDVLADLTTVRKGQFGRIRATVRSVSEVAATPDGIKRVLDNESLSKTILEAGAVFAVEIALTSDPDTPSGYRWTSGTGPDVTITPGTAFSASVTTERVRIISLLIPAVKQLFAGGGAA